MATFTNAHEARYYVVHPLNDVPEVKCDPTDLGPMEMSASVRFSLMALRGYLVGMAGLVLYHVMDLAGVFHHVVR